MENNPNIGTSQYYLNQIKKVSYELANRYDKCLTVTEEFMAFLKDRNFDIASISSKQQTILRLLFDEFAYPREGLQLLISVDPQEHHYDISVIVD